jgi:hypothetical protein
MIRRFLSFVIYILFHHYSLKEKQAEVAYSRAILVFMTNVILNVGTILRAMGRSDLLRSLSGSDPVENYILIGLLIVLPAYITVRMMAPRQHIMSLDYDWEVHSRGNAIVFVWTVISISSAILTVWFS